MKSTIILVTKDALKYDSLPLYGNKLWNTPNINHLASKGTIFCNHYTNAPSTSMAVVCMFSGLNAHELERRYYTEVEHFNQASTVFDMFQDRGYETHVFWTEGDYKATYPYTKCYSKNTIFHIITSKTEEIKQEIIKLNKVNKFLWIHMPAYLNGKKYYGSDIEDFDNFIGFLRDSFGDECIFITSDHGYFSLNKGLVFYGFHVYNDAIKVPFISPRIDNLNEIQFPTSHRQFKEILFEKRIKKQQYVFSDTQYYLQSYRRLAIIKDNYKYIYNKFENSEEFYDLEYDPDEIINLVIDFKGLKILESHRHRTVPFELITYYPYREKAFTVYQELRKVKENIWREGKWYQEMPRKIKAYCKNISYSIKCLKKDIIKMPF